VRVLYHYRIASADGQLVHIREMIEAMRRCGHEVCVVGPKVGGADNKITRQSVAWFRRFCPRVVFELLELAYNIPAFVRLWRAASTFEPDLIYERYSLYLLAGTWAKRLIRVPLVLEVNAPLAEERDRHSGGISLGPIAPWLERKVWCAADRVCAVTGVLARYIAEHGVREEQLVVTPNGVDATRFNELPRPDEAKASLGIAGKFVVGFVGYVRPWHGLDQVLDWMATEEAPDNAILLLVGDGPARGDLVDLARTLCIAERLIVTGSLPAAEIPRHLAAFDIAVLPDVVPYASPLKLLEYMAAGCAILAPDKENIREIVKSAHEAELFEPSTFKQHLSAMVENRSVREKLGERARQKILDGSHGWERNVARLERLCEDIRRG
jgi:glycosyltransferase involved in cell wall biosynthesis